MIEVQPRHHTPRNPGRPTRGPQVAKIAKAKRSPLLPWQSLAGDVALELDPTSGLYHYGIVVVSVPRQSGKTKLEGDLADHRCLTVPRARVWVTMQNGKTVDEWMREEHFASLAGARAFGVPDTKGCKYRKSKRAGSVGVSWPARGSTFTTFPPKRDALHSKQADLVFVDEAWVHDAETGADLRQAIRPTMNTRPGAQLWIVSTRGDDRSVYLDDYITQARAQLGNPDARVCFVDYGIPEDVPIEDAQDLDLIAAHHPAYGHLLTRTSLEAAHADFANDPHGWARAYGNRETRTRSAAIDPAVWVAAGRPARPRPDRAGLAVDATPDGAYAAGALGWREDDQAYVDPLISEATTTDTVHKIGRLATTLGVPILANRASIGVLELTDAIARHYPRVEVTFAHSAEYGSACAVFERGVKADDVHHPNDPDLDAAVSNAVKRPIGDGAWGWGHKDSSGNIAPLVSSTLALRAFDELPPPKRKPVARA